MIFELRRVRSSKRAMRCILFVAVAIVLTASLGAAQSRTVAFRGNTYFGDADLDAVIRPVRNGAVGPVLRRLQDAYIKAGYLFVTITHEADAPEAWTFVIDEKERARYGDVRVSGAAHLSEKEIKQALRVDRGQPYEPSQLQASIEALLARYDEEGFPFVQIWMDSLRLRPERNEVNLLVQLIEGSSQQIKRITFNGLRKTRGELAVRLSGLQEGEAYAGARIEDAYLRLSTSGLFDDVTYPTIRLSPDGGGVEALIDVVEPPRGSRFSAAFGYADRESNQDRVLSGVVDLNLVNIGGTLRDLNIHWQNDGAGRSETRFQFRQRFFLGRRMNMAVRLEQVGLDTLYTWQSLGFETEAPVARLAGALLSLDLATYGDRNTFSLGDVSQTLRLRLAGGFSLTRGKANRGTFLRFRNRHIYGLKDLQKRVGQDESVSQYTLEMHAQVTSDLTQNVHISNELHGFSLESREDFVPLSEQFYLGGAATLRGFRENQFHGRRTAYTRSELRLGRSRSENAYLFVDSGYVLQETQTVSNTVDKDEKVRVGYGFGLRTISRAGDIDISFGVGDKLSLRQTKVHVILNRSF